MIFGIPAAPRSAGDVTAIPSRNWRVVRRRAGPLVFAAAESLRQLVSAGDPELGVGVAEVALDGLEGYVELPCDLAVGVAAGGQPGDAQLTGGQRVHPGAPRAPRPGPGGPQLLACPGGQRPGPAPGGQLPSPGQRVAGRGALAVPAQGCAELGE